MTFWPIIKLSWKNIWRNKTRSGVVITAVVLGTCAGTFMSAFMNGMVLQLIENQLNTYISHIQIHTKQYQENKLPEFYIPSVDSLINDLQSKPFVKGITSRSVVSGLASTTSSTFGVTINGIDPETEPEVFTIHSNIKEGDYFEIPDRNPVLVGEKLAERLKLKLRSKVVLNFQDVDGDISAGAFRVVGIFKTSNTSFDQSNVFVKKEDLNRLIGAENIVHEIDIVLDNFREADFYASQFGSTNPTLAVESWGEVSPSLRFSDANTNMYLYIFMTIILIALTFGIINTMLMAVLERQHELGMLMAIGVNKTRTFVLILSETFFLSIFGAPIGLFIAWAGIGYLAEIGLDLGAFAEGFESFGMSSIIYPVLEPQYYLNVGAMIIITTIIASIYPSIKALKLNPVEAIRKT